MSNPSESELFNKIFINFQQVCYILKFKNNQELYICITSLANELKKNFRSFAHFSRIFFETYAWNSCKKNAIVTFDYIINKNINFPNGKIRQFLASKTEHTDDFLCLNTEHTKSFLHSEPNIRNLAKPNIPKLSYFLDRTYRQFLSFEEAIYNLNERTNNKKAW